MGCKKSWSLGAVGAAVLLATPAMAQDFERDRRAADRGLGVTVLGGLNAYTGDIADATDAGPMLGVAVNTRPLDLVGVEVGYNGARNNFSGLDGALWRHNVGALAKVGPRLGARGDLQPFVGAGLGVSVLNPTGGSQDIYSTDFVTEVPVAAGAEYRFGNGITAGARATFNFLGGENIGVGANGNLFTLGAQLGGRF
jgi:hypothetical protein